MKSMLVSINPMVRVVVADNATEEQIIESARRKMMESLFFEFTEHIEEIKEDLEVPYGEGYNDLKELSEEEQSAYLSR